MKNSQYSLSILLPAYNEGIHIFQNVLRVHQVLDKRGAEIIVIDDGSRDDTFSQAMTAAQNVGCVRVLKLEENCGKGAALAFGFELARGEFVAFLDADMEIRPEYVGTMLDVLQTSGKDAIVGRKVNSHSHLPWMRRMMSKVYRTLVSLLFDLQLHDTQTGVKIFRRQVLETCLPKLSVKGFAFDVELLVRARRAGFQIGEYPVELTYKRTRSLERIKMIHILRMFTDTMGIYLRMRESKP